MKKKVYNRVVLKTCKLVRNAKNERVMKITFPYSKEDVNRLRMLSVRTYHREQNCWSCPLTLDNIKTLDKWGFTFDEKIHEYVRKEKESTLGQIDIEIPGLKGTLRNFQKNFVKFAEYHDGCVLNADDMGLGKTIEAIAWLQLRKELRPAIIIVPACVKLNWEVEINKWMTDPNCQVLSGETPYKIKGDILVINYNIVQYWAKKLKKIDFKVMILDEAQNVKNNSANRTKVVKAIRKGIPHVMSLTGTPIENKPYEIFNAVNMVDSTVFPDYWDFVWKYCDPKNTGFGWDFSGAKDTDKLHRILTESIMIRRLKKDVLPELPPKIRSFIPMELTNREEYNFAEASFISWVRETKGIKAAFKASNAEALSKIEGLKQLAVKGKIVEAISWIKEFLETGNKLVVVTTHKFVLDALFLAFPGTSLKLDGSVTGTKRQKVVEEFQTTLDKNLIIINLVSGGVGITLTAAASMLILELGWGPKKMDQVEDRVHRMTQTRGVNIYYGLARKTIEEKIATIIDKKRKIIDSVMDGIETEESSLLMELMNSYL
jgi:SWI/SNF-related matrix-associated actin-dependent regulator 1 of chromatin subfamily A